MKKIGFLTCSEIPGYGGLLTKYDTEMVEYIRSKGYECDPVIWDREEELEKFDLLFIRTIWDYYKKYDRFYDFLDETDDMLDTYIEMGEINEPDMKSI